MSVKTGRLQGVAGQEQPLSRHQLQIFRFDAKALVAGVILGVVMTTPRRWSPASSSASS
jgi:hypothetical protein